MAAPLRTAATTAAASSSKFVPRAVFEVSPSITRSYFLGHHAGALASMRKSLSNIGLILECRDSRVPLTSTNPLLESSLAGRDRIVVYTKADLCAPGSATRWLEKQQHLLSEWHSSQAHGGVFGDHGSPDEEGDGGDGGRRGAAADADDDDGAGLSSGRTEVVFTDERNPRSIQKLLDRIRARAAATHSLTGLRALVVGMPNAGKSTLLNALRRVGLQLPKAARTGAQPGVTRKMSTPVRIIDGTEPSTAGTSADAGAAGAFVVDTPGVFVPYVGDVEAMLKLSLVGCVKDGLVPAETIADYLLFRLNLLDPSAYGEFCPPTNDAAEFLEAVARRTGKLLRGGVPGTEQAADWVVQQWRKGTLGRFGLDDVSEENLRRLARRAAEGGGESNLSMNQARRQEKEARKARSKAKRAAAGDGGQGG
ncbi:Uu.00g114160.m01.CDS01 [Anthostomella pinea]|uniref:Uu.00g114160.m01.CDS01 n=1 Tax=Anthostomella pinea TaxID=933095 RepID=A0AAI8YGR7_9PEZI|nr:Uu.00g114160.m01.CDS01 [Anthostomella pinea]